MDLNLHLKWESCVDSNLVPIHSRHPLKFYLSRFAYEFNTQTLLENLDSQDETSEELPDQLLPFWE